MKGFLSQEVNDIIFWNNKVASLLILTFVNLAYFLVQFRHYSFITLFSYILIATLFLSFLIHKKASIKVLGSPEDINKLNDTVDSFRLSEEKVKSLTSLLSKFYVRGEEYILNAMKTDNAIHVLKVTATLLLIAQFGKYFSPFTVVWLAGNWLLVWPVIYTHKKDVIDSKYNSVKDVVMKNADPLLKKLPKSLVSSDLSTSQDTNGSKDTSQDTNGSDEKKNQ